LIGRVATGGPGEVTKIGAFNVQHVVAKWNERVRNGVPDPKVSDPWAWEVALVVEPSARSGVPVKPSSSFGATRLSKFSQELSRGVVSLVKNHVLECGGDRSRRSLPSESIDANTWR
jgi:hypothetical protein